MGLGFSGPALPEPASIFNHSRDIGLILTAASPVPSLMSEVSRVGRGFSRTDYAAYTQALT